jgi:hypothetical protein
METPQLEKIKEIARQKGLSLNSYCLSRIFENPQLDRIEFYLKKLLKKNGIE